MTIYSRILGIFCYALCLLYGLNLQGEPPEVEVTEDLKIFLIGKKGKSSKTHYLTKKDSSKTIVFKYQIGRKLKRYSSWALEIRDPVKDLEYRIAFDGKLPPLLHWDGKFNQLNSIEPDGKYFVRLLLINDEDKIYVSPWSHFLTKLRESSLIPRIPRDYIKLYVMPHGTLYALAILTKSQFKMLFPILEFDARLIWKDKHMIGTRVAASSNLLFRAASLVDPASGRFYSDISFYYRHQLFGKSVRRPKIPFIPPYIDPYIAPKLKIRKYPKSKELHLGVRFFIHVLRGFDGTPLNSELAIHARGLTGTGQYDFPFLKKFRIRSHLELGYSLFAGSLVVGLGEMWVTYEGYEGISPGFVGRYQLLTGTNTHGNSITNHLGFFGIRVSAKL